MKITNIQYFVFLIVGLSSAIIISPSIVYAAEENSTSSTNNSTSTTLNNTDVDFATNIEFIKGHLFAATSNKQDGNNELTQTHTFHPIVEIYSLIRDQLVAADDKLNKTLSGSLNNLTSIVFSSTPEEFKESANSVKSLLDDALAKAIPGNEISDVKFNMSILLNLLKTAESEYNIGIANGTIANIAEYQDAKGFVNSAEDLFNKTIQGLNQTTSTKFTIVNDLMNKLNTVIDNKQDATQVSALVNNITTTIPNILNIQLEDLAILVSSDEEPIELINNIRNLINQAVEKIKSGDYQNAETLVVESYLDNFEFLEPEIAKHDESLMKDTESLLREQFINLIREKADINDIQKIIDQINLKINEIEKIFQ